MHLFSRRKILKEECYGHCAVKRTSRGYHFDIEIDIFLHGKLFDK
jgi:hypothetical protein